MMRYFIQLLLTIGLAIPSSLTWCMDDHRESRLHADSQLSLTLLLDSTLAQHPLAGALSSGKRVAEAEQDFSRRWIPDTIQLEGFHLSDRALDDIGTYENEVALSFPLWLPGEKNAQAELGSAASNKQISQANQFRWQVSAELRQLVWQLTLARRSWELAIDQERRLQELLEQVSLFTEAGELSRADQLAILQELAIWKSETLTLAADYQDAAREYVSFTGLKSIPAIISEELSSRDLIEQNHPALQLALMRAAEISAEAEVLRQGNSFRPAIQLFWRGYRGNFAEAGANAVGLGLSVPLGQSPRRKPEFARASQNLAQAEGAVQQMRRQLDLQLHEADHVLHTTRQQLTHSITMMETAQEKFVFDQLAYEIGDISTREWLRRLSEMKEIETSHELLLIRQGAAIAAYNQAVGETL